MSVRILSDYYWNLSFFSNAAAKYKYKKIVFYLKLFISCYYRCLKFMIMFNILYMLQVKT